MEASLPAGYTLTWFSDTSGGSTSGLATLTRANFDVVMVSTWNNPSVNWATPIAVRSRRPLHPYCRRSARERAHEHTHTNTRTRTREHAHANTRT